MPKYKILHLPTATYMYYDAVECDSVLYTEFEAVSKKPIIKYSNIFSDLLFVKDCIKGVENMNEPEGEYKFEEGNWINILSCHLEIVEVSDAEI